MFPSLLSSLLFLLAYLNRADVRETLKRDYGAVSPKSKGTDWVWGIRCLLFTASGVQVPALSLCFSSKMTAVSTTLVLVTNPKERHDTPEPVCLHLIILSRNSKDSLQFLTSCRRK